MPALKLRVAAGSVLASTIAIAAQRKGWLTHDGAIAAAIVGCAVYAGTGLRGSGGVLAFFATSSLLGRLPAAGVAAQRRGNARDAIQVLANGGVPAILALATVRLPASMHSRCFTGFGGAIAAAAADTWATEIGSRVGRNPRSILTLEPMAAGSSGAISAEGLLASLVGATIVARLLAPPRDGRGSPHASTIAAGGLIGSLVDSWCGAAWQEVRYCDACRAETESLVHSCGNRTRHLRGQRWCNNDVVNLIAVSSGAAAAIALQMIDRGAAMTSAVEDGRLTSSATGRVEFPSRAMLGA